MTDPNAFVADQIGQQAETVTGSTSGADITQAVAAGAGAGLGVTEVDVGALASAIQAMQARIDELEAGKAAASGEPLAGTVATINHFLVGHGDPVASELGADLAAAVEEAQNSGDSTRVAQIAEKLDRHLSRNAPYAGENYHFNNARAFVGDLPDLIDAFHPVAVPAGPPAKVVAGSVVG